MLNWLEALSKNNRNFQQGIILYSVHLAYLNTQMYIA